MKTCTRVFLQVRGVKVIQTYIGVKILIQTYIGVKIWHEYGHTNELDDATITHFNYLHI